jgi:hypothetical protein
LAKTALTSRTADAGYGRPARPSMPDRRAAQTENHILRCLTVDSFHFDRNEVEDREEG